MHSYVVHLSPIKQSPACPTYFHASLHDGQNEVRAVSFTKRLYPQLQKAHNEQRVVRILNYRESPNKYDSSKTDLIMGEQCHIEDSDKIIQFSEDHHFVTVPTCTVTQIISMLALEEQINIEGFVDIDNTQIEDIKTKFGQLKKKRDVLINDDTGTIRLVLWASIIDQVASSGVYNIHNLRIKSFNGRYLTTTQDTSFCKSDKTIIKSTSRPDAVAEVMFPALLIDVFEENFFCPKCKHTATPVKDLFIHCSHCASRSLLKTAQKKDSCKSNISC